ncbi:MAG: 2Fe-2S iron-sulfur cluster-binding protein [Burkholderiaceae bacterium]
MKVDIVTFRDGVRAVVGFDYQKRDQDERPMVLDVLLQAQATTMPDLAFRYGCRARNCGVCTVDINGKPRVSCRARAREGDTISAVATLPVVGDLVARRDGVARQLRGRLPATDEQTNLNVEAPDDYHALTACIECYACLDKCPMHERNQSEPEADPAAGFRWGNPFSLLKLQRVRLDPLSSVENREAVLEHAIDLGLDACVDCAGCKCGIGIDLKRKVVAELVSAAGDRLPQG